MARIRHTSGTARFLLGTAACIGALALAAQEAAAQQIPVEFFTCISLDCDDTDTNADYFGPAQDNQFEGLTPSDAVGAFTEASATTSGPDGSYSDAYDG